MHEHEVGWVCLLLLGVGVCVGAQAGDLDMDRATLRGLNGVQVVIEALTPKMEEDGLAAKQLQTDVELRLRAAGIPVLSQAEALNTKGMPYLYVNIRAKSSDDGLYGYSVEVDLPRLQGSIGTRRLWLLEQRRGPSARSVTLAGSMCVGFVRW